MDHVDEQSIVRCWSSNRRNLRFGAPNFSWAFGP